MLWLCICLPQLPLEALRARDDGIPTVVTSCIGQSRWVICRNQAAERQHVKAPMNYATALAMCDELKMLERAPNAERAALERLAAWAYQFSSTVVVGEISSRLHEAQQAALWLEVGASLTLFGGLRALVAAIETEIAALGYTFKLGIGPTLEGAALLARAGIRVAVTSNAALRARIGNLPVQHLALSAQACEQLATAGIRNIGLLLELPRDALAKRFGTEMCDYLARLTGQAPDPRPTFHPPAHYDARFDFDFELRNSEALLFPLQRMLRELAGFLRAMDACVPSFELIFEHREQAPTALRIGLSIPERSPEKLLTLVREHLARTVLAAPTIGLRLIAHELVASSARQSDLFSSALQETEALAHTLDKLVARLGESHVFGLQCIADHRPERAWRKARPDEKRSGMAFPERPLWLLQQPKPLQLASPPMLVAGPERIESGWWDGADVQRDYYVLCTDEHAKLWAYRDHERNGEWYLHGFWA